MNIDFAKLTHITAELTNYFLKMKSRDIALHITTSDDVANIYIASKDIVLSAEQLEKLKTKLSNPRQQEIEGYYWNLAGGDHSGSELRLISAMTDLQEIRSNMEEGTVIKLRR